MKNEEKQGRRSAAQWAQLVRAWERSGLSVASFAATRGLSARSLSWWKWQLSRRKSSARPDAEKLRLLPVHVSASIDGSDGEVAWELCSADGHVLRVHASIERGELDGVLSAIFGPTKGRR